LKVVSENPSAFFGESAIIRGESGPLSVANVRAHDTIIKYCGPYGQKSSRASRPRLSRRGQGSSPWKMYQTIQQVTIRTTWRFRKDSQVSKPPAILHLIYKSSRSAHDPTMKREDPKKNDF
jgi:hypothetical protein